ncbi:unnamed protein product [Trichogramma brassicae]|uniref:Reverse transcriptase domain-containing protein n=1 Tax=Trichogramma brassicae TaxID=86971 RepID=A0A6H5IZ34_9HYME|nr:unnamed protein product [Trichogramma brassicae]
MTPVTTATVANANADLKASVFTSQQSTLPGPSGLNFGCSPTSYAQAGEKLTTMHDVEHAIDAKDDVPVNAKPYRFPQPLREELERQLTEMLKSGIIEESKSSYRSNIFLVPKAGCFPHRKYHYHRPSIQ